jgi:hypothetical protein
MRNSIMPMGNLGARNDGSDGSVGTGIPMGSRVDAAVVSFLRLLLLLPLCLSLVLSFWRRLDDDVLEEEDCAAAAAVSSVVVVADAKVGRISTVNCRATARVPS